MARYIIQVFKDMAAVRECETRHIARTTGLTSAVQTEKVGIFTKDLQSFVPLPDGGGAIGTLFDGRGKVFRAGDGQQRSPRNGTNKPFSLTDVWGAYVAITNLSSAAAPCIWRDPSGFLPCYFFEMADRTIIASDMTLLAALLPHRPDIDWWRLAQGIAQMAKPSAETALAGVRELLPGQVLTFGADRLHISNWWSPWDHCEPTTEDASARIFEAVTTAVGAWASIMDEIVLSASGGLDSSIVGAALAEARSSFSCLTMVTQLPDGDERSPAGAVARHIDRPLHAHWFATSEVDLAQTTSAHLPRPLGPSYAQSFDIALAKLGSNGGRLYHLTGNGGDNVFSFMRSASPVVDRVRSEGWRRGALATLGDVARLSETGCLAVARKALTISWRRNVQPAWRCDTSLLTAECAQWVRSGEESHPWLCDARGKLPGKALHVAMLLRIQSYLIQTPRQGAVMTIAPLMSQPVVEACLSIPSWLWCAGGIDRAPARAAFRHLLPEEIVGRRRKGGPDSFLIALVMANRAQILRHLRDGLLAAHAIVDREAIERALRADQLQTSNHYLRILALMEAEAWARYWAI